ncbi:MAG: motility protein A [Acidobacteriota bacterium]
MDISTIIGLFLGVALVIGAIVTGDSPVIFLNVPSLMIVVGGTLGVTLIKNELRAVFGMLGVIKKAFLAKLPTPESLIAEMVTLAKTARKESLLALEKVPIHDNFMKFGLGMAVDGTEPKDIRAVLETEVAYQVARHRAGQNILEGIGASAPAFGMIGTLIGLVQMLTSMDDPKNIGPAMAVAILTTLYGAIIANLIALPLADKLKTRSAAETLIRQIITDGILSIAEGDHPLSMEQKLKAFLEPKRREAGSKAA